LSPPATSVVPEFPRYTGAESAADTVIHILGLPAAIAATAWLLASIGPDPKLAPAAIYAAGIIAMLAASAAYNIVRPGRIKARLRRLDHAMIFVAIAATYTPFTLQILDPPLGRAACALVWTIAALGILLKLAFYDHVERLSLALYLGMGWLIVLFIRPLMNALTGPNLALLLAGGLVYSAGSLLHTFGRRLKFHNALWHVMVLAAAGLHFAAIARLLLEPST